MTTGATGWPGRERTLADWLILGGMAVNGVVIALIVFLFVI